MVLWLSWYGLLSCFLFQLLNIHTQFSFCLFELLLAKFSILYLSWFFSSFLFLFLLLQHVLVLFLMLFWLSFHIIVMPVKLKFDLIIVILYQVCQDLLGVVDHWFICLLFAWLLFMNSGIEKQICLLSKNSILCTSANITIIHLDKLGYTSNHYWPFFTKA